MANPLDDSESDLIRQAVLGDRAALERLLLDLYAPLVRHLTPRLPESLQSVLSIEDVLQETFSQVFTDIGCFKPTTPAAFYAWVTTIADHRLTDARRALRRKKRGGDYQPAHQPATTSSAACLVELLAAEQTTPSQSFAREEAIQAVQLAMAELPADQLQAVRLRFVEGRSADEIAAAMQRTPGAVRGLLDRAKRAMRETLSRASHYFHRG